MAEKYEMEGIITKILEVKQLTNNFKKQDFILESGTEKYPNPVRFQTSGKHLGYVNNQMINKQVIVEFYINGKAVPKKGYYVNLSAVSIRII